MNKQKELAGKLLEIASDRFGNNGCNDLDEDVFFGWSLEERKQFVKEYHEWNGDPEEFDEDHLYLPDFAVMDFLSHKLINGYI